MMTITDAKEMCLKIAKERGISLARIPILENGRLRTTLGRVVYQWDNKSANLCHVVRIEFSKKHLEYSDEQAVIDTILHEMGHAINIIETGKHHGHDALFRQTCREIGTTDFHRFTKHDVFTNMPASAKVKKTPSKVRPYKYELLCSCCGKSNGKRKVRSKVIDHPEMYLSGCCHAELEVIEL